jgi:hypothetical protein
MTVETFSKSECFNNLKGNLQELSYYLFEQLEKNGIKYKIHTGESYHRFVLWADEALERNRDRDFLTIFTRKNGLLLWPKFYGIGWKTDEAIRYQKEVYHFNQIDEKFVELIKKAFVSICEKDSLLNHRY